MFAPDDAEYNGIRSEINAWFNRLSMLYSFSFAALAVILNFQLGNAFGERPNFWAQLLAFLLISTLVHIIILLIARTTTLIHRQTSYIKVFFENEGDRKKWITRNRLLWNKIEGGNIKTPLRWVAGKVKEQKYYCYLIILIALSSSIATLIVALTDKIELGCDRNCKIGIWLVVSFISYALISCAFCRLKEVGALGRCWVGMWKEIKKEEIEQRIKKIKSNE